MTKRNESQIEAFERDMGINLDGDRPVFVMLVGLPGSGKTTFRKRFEHLFINVSSDDYLEEVAQSMGVSYDHVWKDSANAANQHAYTQFDIAKRGKMMILWDQTNLTRKKRKKVVSQLPPEYIAVAVVVSVSDEVRQERLKNRSGKTVPAHVDAQMQSSFVLPGFDEGFDAIIYVEGAN